MTEPGEQLAAEASAYLAGVHFGAQLGRLISDVVVDATGPLRDAGGDL